LERDTFNQGRMAKEPVCGEEGAQGVGGGGHAQGHAFEFGSVGAAQHSSAEGRGEMDGRQAAAGSNAAVGDGEGAQGRGKGRLGGFWPARTIKRCVPFECASAPRVHASRLHVC
jgi:hypothetical protein